MARYSVELHAIVNSGVNIFNFKYPFYDESKREKFERNFIRHFYFREIGAETIDRFCLYLADKMNTVFPYYNKLFEASQIEYNVLDNYNVKEEYTIERENKGKTAGVSSSVGRVEDNQSTEGKENATASGEVNTTNNTTQNGSESMTENVDTTTHSETDAENTLHNVKKFLDTPQGKLDLENTDYLTNLTDDRGEGTNSETKDVTGNTQTSRTGSNSSESDQTGNSSSSDESERISSSSFQGDQKSTQDSNTRSESQSEQVEHSVYTKKGNIGVDTDADMLQKHILLQKTLRNIEKMFFDECEDLFMLVY